MSDEEEDERERGDREDGPRQYPEEARRRAIAAGEGEDRAEPEDGREDRERRPDRDEAPRALEEPPVEVERRRRIRRSDERADPLGGDLPAPERVRRREDVRGRDDARPVRRIRGERPGCPRGREERRRGTSRDDDRQERVARRRIHADDDHQDLRRPGRGEAVAQDRADLAGVHRRPEERRRRRDRGAARGGERGDLRDREEFGQRAVGHADPHDVAVGRTRGLGDARSRGRREDRGGRDPDGGPQERPPHGVGTSSRSRRTSAPSPASFASKSS